MRKSALKQDGRIYTVTFRVSPKQMAVALAYLLSRGVIIRTQADLVHRIFSAAVDGLIEDDVTTTLPTFVDDAGAEAYLRHYFHPEVVKLSGSLRLGAEHAG